jgi:hypothetical protein
MNEFDDLAGLDEVFGPLRSPARPAELLQESAIVDLMANAHRTAEGKHMFTSRRARIATLVAAGVLGFGGMAAASPSLGQFGAPPAEVPPVEVPPVEVPPVEVPPVGEAELVDEPEGADQQIEEQQVEEDQKVEEEPAVAPFEETPVELVDDPDTNFVETSCEDGNHGKTVSAVARGDFDLDKYAENNPEADIPTVVDAAQSSCGKTDRDKDDSEAEVEIESEESDIEEPEVEETEKPEVRAERPGRSDKGPDGPGNGRGNGNGKRGG